ncbi:TonB family protein [Adhaeribacter pallidiroseus]|uniref:TonB C-terminal domain-containing protein n=1 Tax=Adhaeribacter pallidiroseus TaxID=2072847 RepID=A0A369QBV7_9BACT|nr:TonB family protein [Adhaeribacter pallidiroseus]RDC62383.1 hypothetical protein AHMF7616_00976 [Adhaeribacter pallidiroseus]
MKTLTTPDYSLDDIIFEGRHQAYGAYALRKAYPQHIKRATTYMFAAVGLIIAAARLGIAFKPDLVPDRTDKRIIEISTVVMPKVEEPVREKPVVQASPKVITSTPTKRLVTTHIVPDPVPVNENMPDQTDFTNAEPGLEDVVGKPGAGPIAIGADSDHPMAGTAEETTENVRDFVDIMPEFPGGLKQMYDFIRRTLRYPAEAQRQGLEGTVVVTFVVGKSGEISDIKVIKDVGGGTAEEAIRVIRSMKPWQPGRQKGQPVPVRFTLPLRFSLAS